MNQSEDEIENAAFQVNVNALVASRQQNVNEIWMSANHVVNLTQFDWIFLAVRGTTQRRQNVDGKRELKLETVLETSANKILPKISFVFELFLQFDDVTGVDNLNGKVGKFCNSIFQIVVVQVFGKVFQQSRDDLDDANQEMLNQKVLVVVRRVFEQVKKYFESEIIFIKFRINKLGDIFQKVKRSNDFFPLIIEDKNLARNNN